MLLTVILLLKWLGYPGGLIELSGAKTRDDNTGNIKPINYKERAYTTIFRPHVGRLLESDYHGKIVADNLRQPVF